MPKYDHLPSVCVAGIQGIYALLIDWVSISLGLSAKFGVAVFKASILYSLGGPSAKVCSSAKFCVMAFKASMLY